MTNTLTVSTQYYNDIMLCNNGTLPSDAPSVFMGTCNFSHIHILRSQPQRITTRLQIGDILWMKTYDPPANNKTVIFAGVDPVNRVFVENIREDINFVGYNLDTGAKLWDKHTTSTNGLLRQPSIRQHL